MIQHLPISRLTAFEGGEMWRQISTVGYKDIVVEFHLKAEGLSGLSHGYRPWLTGDKKYKLKSLETAPRLRFPYGSNSELRPYMVCQSKQEQFLRCPDAGAIEEQFMVMYTIDYDDPYNAQGEPFFKLTGSDTPAGIAKWGVAEIISHPVLLEEYTGDGKVVSLDFSMFPHIDDNPNFGIWFRSQLDSDGDRLLVDNIKVLGKGL